MRESWMEYLHRIEVFSEQGVELCDDCNKRPGEVQMKGVLASGQVIPTRKLCHPCHQLWKKYARLVVR